MTHQTKDINRFGSPLNVHSGTGENQLKIKAKKNARKGKKIAGGLEHFSGIADIEKIVAKKRHPG